MMAHFGRRGSLDENVIHVNGYQDPPSHSQEGHNRLKDLCKHPWATFEPKREDLPFKQRPKPLESQKLPKGLIDGDMQKSILQVHTAEPSILLDPVMYLSKTFHSKFVLLYRLIELLKVQNGSELPRTVSLSHGKV